MKSVRTAFISMLSGILGPNIVPNWHGSTPNKYRRPHQGAQECALRRARGDHLRNYPFKFEAA